MRTIGKYLASCKLLSSLFLFSIIIEVAYAVAAPLSLKYLIDEAFTPRNLQAFILILGILLAGGLISIVAGAGGDYSLGRVSGEIIRRLRTDLFYHLQKQSLPFFERYRIGDLVTRFGADMGSIERAIRVGSPYLIKEGLSLLLGLSMLFALEWKLTLVMAAGSVLMFALPKLLQRRAEADNVNYKEAQERFTNTIDEVVKGHKTIRGLHQQSRFRERAQLQIRELFASGLKLHMTGALMERLPLTALMILNGVMIGFGGYLIFTDGMSVGSFVAFFTLFMTVGQSVSSLSFLVPGLIESAISFRRIGEIMQEQPDVPEAKQPVRIPPGLPDIRMDEVTFGYTAGNDQLKQVSLSVAAGSYEAFVGPSGSGKSTALQLLARFYDPQQGTVSINGTDLRQVEEASLRSQTVLVAQDTFLFNTTIRENLLLDRAETITEAEMTEAARQAQIHDVIASWPGGYDTPVHHEGGSMSGGERQRIAIARALLRKPGLLLLDEVTSALDPASEADINKLIAQMRGRQTVISVTHRLASVVHADRIHVFESGRIVESGTHQELLAFRGLYFSLWQKQHGFQLSEDGLHATVEIERLAQMPFFEGLDRPVLKEISALFSTETCHAGDAVVIEGEEGSKFYIIVRGKFEVMKQIPGQGQQRVAVLQDGDHFGEIALLRNIPRTATVKAMGHSILLSVRRDAFHQLTARYPQLLKMLEQSLAKRL
ncbi:ABC transporter transmembrane domain-containing protein [Paenibacillus pinihumi]|uniref:ABC transporter transmembrane domain-containing protein n=1 Tax=Paenibacillus pinihumi TaxID=669462 RepID=UPI0005624A58|nr:ABC transporter transmembrane domain-containing protein [Paenibacillus pinihumi]